jgi:hypothetical protein
MMGNVILIDADGKRHECQSSLPAKQANALKSHASSPIADITCAKISLGDGWLRINVNLTDASDRSLHTLIRELAVYAHDCDHPVFMDEDDGVVRRFANGQVALRHLVTRLASQAQQSKGSLARRQIAFATGHRSFQQLGLLCQGSDVLNFGSLRSPLQGDFANRYCVVRPDSEIDRLVLQEFGDGYDHLDRNWEQRTAGSPFGEFEDREYSAFVQRAYREAWSAWKPVLEEIEVPNFKPPLPSKYQRILIPIRLATGPAMLSASRY